MSNIFSLDPDSDEKHQKFNLIIFVISSALSLYYAYLIITCSTKKMKAFRIFMIIYICSCFTVELVFFLARPMRLFPHSIFYSKGFLYPISSTIFGLFFVAMIAGLAIMTESLCVVLLERHFQILQITNVKANRLRCVVYGIQVITLLLELLTAACLFVNDVKNQDITKHLPDFESISTEPSLYAINYSWNLITISAITFAIIYALYRLTLLIWLLHENYNYPKNTHIILSTQSKKQFNLMLQTTIAQLITFTIFAIPCIGWFLTFVIPSLPPSYHKINLCLETITSMYPIFDVIVVIIVVKPYRNATKKLFKVKIRTYNSSTRIHQNLVLFK